MKKFSFTLVGAAIAVLASASPARADLVVIPIGGAGGAADATQLASLLTAGGSGITINSATYTGVNLASGTFSGGAGIIGIDTGILLTSGSVDNMPGPNDSSGASQSNGLAGDASLTALSGQTTFDASVLEINFTPTGDTVQFSYVFGSEEYLEYVNQFNDVFGFFVNGTNFALVPGTSTPVSINTVNTTVNSGFFVNNTDAHLNTQLDGLTVVLSFIAPVNPNVINTLKIAIADGGDTALDSGVFLQAGSFAVCGQPGQPECGGGTPAPIPEPASMMLMLTGLAGVAARARRRRS